MAAVNDSRRLAPVVVVGSGIAGLMATLTLADRGVPTLLLSRVPARRSASVVDRSALRCVRSHEDASRVIDATLRAGALLAERAPVVAFMHETARIADALESWGVRFRVDSEMPEAAKSAIFAGNRTAQQVLYSLDDEVRRREPLPVADDRGVTIVGARLVQRLEGWTLRDLVHDDDGRVVGVVAEELASGVTRSFAADGVCLATGGMTGPFGRTTSGAYSAGTGSVAAARAGAVFANAEFVRFRPLAIAGTNRGAALDERLIALGARLWLPKDPTERRVPAAVPESDRDVLASGREQDPPGALGRAVVDRYFAEDAARAPSILGGPEAFLDLGGVEPRLLRGELREDLDLYALLIGDDPRLGPMRVFPAADVSLGGLWVDHETTSDGELATASVRHHATSVLGLYAAGEAAHQYHGAAELPDNRLAASLFGAALAARSLVHYRQTLPRSAADRDPSLFVASEALSKEKTAVLLRRESDGPSLSHVTDELGRVLFRALAGTRDDGALDLALERLNELEHDVARTPPPAGASPHFGAAAVRDVEDHVFLARTMLTHARHRDESRGVHAKRGRPRDDARWLRHTFSRRGGDGRPELVRRFECPSPGARLEITDSVRRSSNDADADDP
ncbi:MAG TPA: FAD-binding protein [Polyangiaceae bacterium]|nr:FAD-binding protein [Polyangiaceae bacterium]